MRTSRCILYTAVGTVLSLLYVFQQTEIVKLGYKVTRTEKVLEATLDRKTSLEYTLSSLESSQNLDKNLFFQNSGFEMAQEYKFVRVSPAQKKGVAVTKATQQTQRSIFKRLALSSLFASRQAEAKTIK